MHNTVTHRITADNPFDYADAQARADYAADRQRHTVPAPVQHYALYHDVAGVATRRAGGWTFQGDGSVDTWLVSYKDADLTLLGRCDLAEKEDTRPLWMQVADPATYNGTYGRDLVRGR
jgi:hypothetical protein